jgi:outer membrane protein OmpA-like peptidoglycan-associated protein
MNIKPLLIVALLLMAATVESADFSGTWKGDKGGTFYLSQDRGRLYWYAEQLTRNPYWAHVFTGKVKENNVRGQWFDVPKGKKRERGGLEANLSENGNVIEIKNTNFVATKLRRVQDNVAVITRKSPAVAMPVTANEDCISFSPDRVGVKKANNRWKLAEGNNWLFDFDQSQVEANQALSIIRQYRMNSVCYVGRPQPSLTYLLTNGQAPLGKKVQEDCVMFDPKKLQVKQVHGSWKIVEDSHWLFDFGSNVQEAKQSLGIIRKYQFRHSCFVGRPDPSFKYLRQ